MENLEIKSIKGYTVSALAQGETNDCFVRALASSMDIHYDVAHGIAKKTFKRLDRKGTANFMIRKGMQELEENGLELDNTKYHFTILNGRHIKNRYKLHGEIIDRRKTVKSFIKDHQKGSYVLLVANHAFTLRDGKLIDNSGEEFRPTRKVQDAFAVRKESGQLGLF